MKPYRMSDKFKAVWDSLPEYNNKGSSIWAYRTWKSLKLNDDHYHELDIIRWVSNYFEEIGNIQYAYSPGKLFELGVSKEFKVKSQADKFREKYTRGVK